MSKLCRIREPFWSLYILSVPAYVIWNMLIAKILFFLKVPIPSNFVLKIKIHFFNLSFENKTYTEIISDYLCTRQKSVGSDTTSKKYQRQRKKVRYATLNWNANGNEFGRIRNLQYGTVLVQCTVHNHRYTYIRRYIYTWNLIFPLRFRSVSDFVQSFFSFFEPV